MRLVEFTGNMQEYAIKRSFYGYQCGTAVGINESPADYCVNYIDEILDESEFLEADSEEDEEE